MQGLKKNIKVFFVILGLAVHTAFAQHSIDLSGKWLCSEDSVSYIQEIQLPGTTDEVGVGLLHQPGSKHATGEPEIWQLARKYTFVGRMWYQKEVEIPESWSRKQINLFLERCMWQTRLYVNGIYAAGDNSLCTPHNLDVSSLVRPGKNLFTLCVDNTPYVHLGTWSHGYSPGIQTVWNGVVGDIRLCASDLIAVDDVQCYTSLKKKELTVKLSLVNKTGKPQKGKVKIKVIAPNGKAVHSSRQALLLDPEGMSHKMTVLLEDEVLPWDEFTPNLYTLSLQTNFGESNDEEMIRFGFRDVEVADGRLLVNGYKTFLRGEHDAGSFPLTGYPSMDKKDWIRIFKIGKNFGLNHWRFHSWCPPEAAFSAADEVGVYLQPELPLFSQKWEHTLIGKDVMRDEFLFSELKRILDTYGNHPSFMLMCMGNELKGDTSVLEKWVAWGKTHDKRHLFASNSNLEAMGKYLPLEGDEFQVAHAVRVDGKRYERRMGRYFNSEKPNTAKDYSHTMNPPNNKLPIIVHELGQWSVFPDFKEIPKYTGVRSPRNLEVFRNRLRQKGMEDQADDFLFASGRWAAKLYKEEMERVLRTPGMTGFQLLDLRDYQAQGSALVGLLNAFWESKGLITPEEFRQSCNDRTLLLKMGKRVWENDETFRADIVFPNYGKKALQDIKVDWAIYANGEMVFTGHTDVPEVLQGEVNFCGEVVWELNRIAGASQLEIQLNCFELGIKNAYHIWVYPKKQLETAGDDIFITRKLTTDVLKQLRKGAKVLFVPKELADGERMAFTTPFWSTVMFDYQPKTMGLLCNPSHPLFADFPTECGTDWQWWELVNTTVARINQLPRAYRPIVQVIDHPVRNDKLGAIMETRVGEGKLLISTFDIITDLDNRPVARQLRNSILQYMKSDKFIPEEVPKLLEIFTSVKKGFQYRNIQVGDDHAEHPVMFAFDNDIESYWQMPNQQKKSRIEITLLSERYITGCHWQAVGKFRSIKVFVTNKKEDWGDPIIIGNDPSQTALEAISWDNGFTVQKGKKGKYVAIELEQERMSDRLYEFSLVFGD